MYIWRGRAHTNSRHELTGLSTRTQNFEKCSYLSQNHFGSALSQFSSTWLFVFQLTGDSGAPLKQCFADLKYQFSLFQIDCGSNGWSRQNLWFWLIFGRPNGPRKNARMVWEFADSLHDNFWSLHAGWSYFAVFIWESGWIRLNPASSQAISCSFCIDVI